MKIFKHITLTVFGFLLSSASYAETAYTPTSVDEVSAVSLSDADMADIKGKDIIVVPGGYGMFKHHHRIFLPRVIENAMVDRTVPPITHVEETLVPYF